MSVSETDAKQPQEAVTGTAEDFDCLKAFIVSDVHLNNHPYNMERETENPRRRNFRLFLTQLNREIRPSDKALLILNGDILDITGSWVDSPMPWDSDRKAVEKALQRLLLAILENNLAMIVEIRKFLRNPFSEVIYVFGNHDGLLQHYPSAQTVIRNFIAMHVPGHPDHGSESMHHRIRFVERFVSEELGLYVEHGHRLDPFNRSAVIQPPLGDVINVLIVNRFVETAVARLRERGYSETLIARLHNRLHDIEYLRPLSLLPVWIQNIAHQYHTHPENVGKREAVDKVLIEAIAEILSNPLMLRLLVERVHLPQRFLTLCIRLMLRVPAILPLISFVASKITRQGHSNKAQYKMAQKIYLEQGHRLLVFGHTHIPVVLPLSESAYYFNTGSWKPVINLFKYSKDPVELEYLNPELQFNKVERSGIVRIEKHDLTGREPIDFSLQTIQSGLS